MKPRLHLFLAALTVLILTPGVHAGDEAPAARAYFEWVVKTVDRTDADMAQITRAAEMASEPFVAGHRFAFNGGEGLNEEMGARAGGFAIYRCEAARPGDAVVFALGVTTAKQPDAAKMLEAELAQAEKALAQGSVVIAIASVEQLESLHLLERARKACSVLLDNHAPAGDGLMKDASGRGVIPTFTTANAIVAWAWTAELFAACTRRGKTPVMNQSVMLDTKLARSNKYKGVQFHDDLHVAPQEAGKLGHAYLKALRGVLVEVGTAGWPSLAEAAHRAAGTIMDGGKTYFYTFGHYIPYHRPGVLAADPALFTSLNENYHMLAQPGLRDFVLAMGYAFPPYEKLFGHDVWGDTDQLRGAGRGVAWVVAAFNFSNRDLRPGEFIVDQQWTRGDALLTVPGYDVKILPSSGVVEEAMLWMITAQAYSEVREHEQSIKRAGR